MKTRNSTERKKIHAVAAKKQLPTRRKMPIKEDRLSNNCNEISLQNLKQNSYGIVHTIENLVCCPNLIIYSENPK